MHWLKRVGGNLGCLGAIVIVSAAFAATSNARPVPMPQNQQPAAQSAVSRTLGTIQSITGNQITLTTQGGGVLDVTVQDNARILRIEPGEKDLKNATPIHLQDLVTGDRILVFGKASADSKSFAAATVIAMKKADIDAKQQKDREDWQKRGVGGLVSAVDPASGTITISVASFGGPKSLAIQTSKETTLRRYAPDSVKFDDAKVGTLDQIKPGDQLRALGTRSADGASLTAEEIVSGSFRNIAGTISSLNPSANTMTVMDLATKKPLTVKVTSDSEVRKLPLMMAQGIAMRLKGAAGGPSGAAGQGQGGAAAGAHPPENPPANSQRPDGQGGPPKGEVLPAEAGEPRTSSK